VSLRDLYKNYNDKIQFILIYTREAHPTDGWYMGDHEIRNHQSMAERREVAGMCEVALQYGIKTYVDEMDDAVSEAYASLPDRLYLVGLGGTIVYAGDIGPFGFKPAELKDAMDRYLTDMTGNELIASQ
jgi:hypothetical protein